MNADIVFIEPPQPPPPPPHVHRWAYATTREGHEHLVCRECGLVAG